MCLYCVLNAVSRFIVGYTLVYTVILNAVSRFIAEYTCVYIVILNALSRLTCNRETLANFVLMLVDRL